MESMSLTTMTMIEERQRIEDHLAVILSYLNNKFPNYTIREKSASSMYHLFMVTSVELNATHMLKVMWPRLTDRSNTPAKTQAALNMDDVASEMIQASGNYFQW